MTDLEREIEDFKASFCPYGYLDIKKAVVEALEAGKDGDWAVRRVCRILRYENNRPRPLLCGNGFGTTDSKERNRGNDRF
jgi:hypothetical protein